MNAFEDVLSRLDVVRRNESKATALCPAHDDNNPSLSVTKMPGGDVRLKCFAGCSTEQVVESVGLTKADLFPKRNGHRKILATYAYTDEAGNLLHQSVRYTPKSFSQQRPDGNGGWIIKGVFDGVRPVLYRLPLVLKTAEEGGTIWVFEGEEDVHAAEECGLVATTNPMGAGKWRDHYSDFLQGAHVLIVPDNDKAGREHARRVVESLQGKAASVKIVELPELSEGGDFRDWMRNGGTKDKLLQLATDTPEVSPSSSLIDNDGDTPTGIVNFGTTKRPSNTRSYIVEGIFPKGFPSIIFGDGGTAKSLLAESLLLDAARGASTWMGHNLDYHGPGLLVDFELDLEEQSRRMYQLAEGVGLGKPPDGVYYFCAAGRSASDVLTQALECCKKMGIKLVIIDSIGFALDGDAEASRDVLKFFRKYIDPFRAAGITVIMVDHQAKLQGSESYHLKSPFGSVYKRNSTRSVIQVQGVDQRDGELVVRFRHHKANFNAKFNPFEVQILFQDTKIEMRYQKLKKEDLAGEGSLNATDKVRIALREGPSYPKDLAELTGLSIGTAQNALTRLRKKGEVVPTGKKSEDRAEQVSLSPRITESDNDTGGGG